MDFWRIGIENAHLSNLKASLPGVLLRSTEKVRDHWAKLAVDKKSKRPIEISTLFLSGIYFASELLPTIETCDIVFKGFWPFLSEKTIKIFGKRFQFKVLKFCSTTKPVRKVSTSSFFVMKINKCFWGHDEKNLSKHSQTIWGWVLIFFLSN